MLSVRAATERDYAAVARIQGQCPEAAQWPVGDYSNFRVLVAVTENGIAGFCAWRQTMPDEAELLNLAVAPEARRQGLAGRMLAVLCEAASGSVFLEVAADNEPAIALYRRHGWVSAGIRKGYYRHGRIDGIVMKKGSW